MSADSSYLLGFLDEEKKDFAFFYEKA